MHEKRIKTFVKHLHGRTCLFEDVYDLYYFSGLQLSGGVLLLSQEVRALFVDGKYFEKAKKTTIFDVFPIEELKFHLEKFSSLVIDSAKTSLEIFQYRQKTFPHISWAREPRLTKKLRAIKDEKELQIMRRAANLTKQGFLSARKKIEEGVTEKEIAWEFEKFCREHGAEKMAFDTIVAFGDNGAFPHHRASGRRYREGETVLIDCGCVVEAYAADMTRTIVGMSKEVQRLQKIVDWAQEAALEKCKAGVAIKQLDIAAREVMREEGLEELFIHSLGHGIGLETHEYPRIRYEGEDADVILEEGMVVTIEPGLYRPDVGGVRREDTVVVQRHGVENFYGDLS